MKAGGEAHDAGSCVLAAADDPGNGPDRYRLIETSLCASRSVAPKPTRSSPSQPASTSWKLRNPKCRSSPGLWRRWRRGVYSDLVSWSELSRSYIDLKASVAKVRRATVCVDGGGLVGEPKSDAGIRAIAMPPHIVPAVKTHLARHVARGGDSLLLPVKSGRYLQPTTQAGTLTGRVPM